MSLTELIIIELITTLLFAFVTNSSFVTAFTFQ